MLPLLFPLAKEPIGICYGGKGYNVTLQFFSAQRTGAWMWAMFLRTFYDTVVASVACWGGGCSKQYKNRLTRLLKRASSVCGCPLDSIEVVGERRALAKLSATMNNTSHPLHQTVSAFSNRLLHPKCKKERFHRSFIPSQSDCMMLHSNRTNMQ